MFHVSFSVFARAVILLEPISSRLPPTNVTFSPRSSDDC